MNLQQRIDAMLALGKHLAQNEDAYLDAIMQRTYHNNRWFTIENQQQAIQAIATQFLAPDALTTWLSSYNIPEKNDPKNVGLIMAGNIPLVGFHDVLCVFLSGHRSIIKLSDKDQYLLPYLLKLLKQIDPATEAYFTVVDKLKDFDAVIATGSNNSARYFEAYFGKYPNIIRKNRNGVVVLDGTETAEELQALGQDVFQYFGLGCRNISKLYVPEGYQFEALLEALHEYKEIVLHSKYKNNFDYHYAIYIINRAKYLANGCIILQEKEAIASPIANLHYEYYENTKQVSEKLKQHASEIQLVVSKTKLNEVNSIAFGQAQQPALSDYADGVDTMAFLRDLS
ncbi:MAG: acyl-CoA reductase [Bacteroidota bacterium]